jgi:hypothetical protein
VARAAAPSKRSPRASSAHGPGVPLDRRLRRRSRSETPWCLSSIGMPRAGATRDGEGAAARMTPFDFGIGRGAPRFLLVGSTLVHLGQPALDAAG